jgi:release factor glutamine methyltransferase
MPTTTIAQALARAQAQGLARIDAQMLLLHLLGRPVNDRAWLLTHDGDALAPHDGQRYTALCARRAGGEPVAYLTGQKEFWGLPLAVDARVLDPRPDTETLVAWALEVLQNQHAPRIADLGTGSGAIALALQHERRDASVLAVDASADALAVARANAERLGLPVRLQHGNWLASITGPFDAIVSNPPYIAGAGPASGSPHARAAVGPGQRRRRPGRHPRHHRPGPQGAGPRWLAADRAWLGSGASRAGPAACRGPCPGAGP